MALSWRRIDLDKIIKEILYCEDGEELKEFIPREVDSYPGGIQDHAGCGSEWPVPV